MTILGAEGVRLVEGAHINKSLLTLGTVISQLAQDSSQHISFRDSKLTKILQPSLGGNSKTAIICTITPSLAHRDETKSTLQFASRARQVKNKPIINEILDPKAELAICKMRIKELKYVALTANLLFQGEKFLFYMIKMGLYLN